jgi:hypothetical protein
MGQLSNKLRNSTDNGLMFWCTGCNSPHQIKHGAGSGPRWGWNGDAERPTFVPSVLVTYDGTDAGVEGAPPAVCHSFVTDGRIQYLGDCTHSLANQTVDLADWPDRYLHPTEDPPSD